MLRSSCIMPHCTRPNTEKLFTLPKREEKLLVWLKAINMEHIVNMTPAKIQHHRICARHFTRKHFTDDRMCKLNRNAIPNQNLSADDSNNIIECDVDINRVFVPTPRNIHPSYSELFLSEHKSSETQCNDSNFVYRTKADTEFQESLFPQMLADITVGDSNNDCNSVVSDVGASAHFGSNGPVVLVGTGSEHIPRKPILLNPQKECNFKSPPIEFDVKFSNVPANNLNMVYSPEIDTHTYCSHPSTKENLTTTGSQTFESYLALKHKTMVLQNKLKKIQKVLKVTNKQLLRESAIRYVETSCGLNESGKILVKSQIGKGAEWDIKAKYLFLGLFKKSATAYKHLQTIIKCPSTRTLQRFQKHVSAKTEAIIENVVKQEQ